MRFNNLGENITDDPDRYSDTDCEVVATNFPHPCIRSGQHTNGPGTIWIREAKGDWIMCDERSIHQVKSKWKNGGIEAFK